MVDRFLREREVRQITGLSRSSRWRLEQLGLFPRRRAISPGAVAWLESEIEDWVAQRPAASGPSTEVAA